MTYSGVKFRSTLEADWAATLDSLDIVWQYEPSGITLPSGVRYRPDFFLPEIATWLEVKGPHNERITKAEQLQEAVRHHPNCDCNSPSGDEDDPGTCYDPYQLVVVGLASVRSCADWYVIGSEKRESVINRCALCRKWYWCDSILGWGCRSCSRYQHGKEYVTWFHVPGSEIRDKRFDEGVKFVRAQRR